MGYINDNLGKDEKIVKKVELSGLVWLEVIFWFLLFFPVGIYKLIQVLTTDQAITNKKVIQKSGWISRNIEEMRLEKIETVEFSQSIFGRILGYGNVKVTGTMSSCILTFVSNPRKLKTEIDNLL